MGKHWLRLSMVCLVIFVVMITPVYAQAMNNGIVIVTLPDTENNSSGCAASPSITISASSGQCFVVRAGNSTTVTGNVTANRPAKPNSLW